MDDDRAVSVEELELGMSGDGRGPVSVKEASRRQVNFNLRRAESPRKKQKKGIDSCVIFKQIVMLLKILTGVALK
jgi:hypothetical protein